MDDMESDIYDPVCFLSNGKRKFMRVFISYEGDRISMDIPVGVTVGKIKSLISKKLSIPNNHVQMSNETQMKKILVLNFAGAELPDHWILSDLSISPGSSLKAYMKGEMDPILYFKIGYNQEIIPVLEKINLRDLSVADLRTLASRKSGLPCSVFRMLSEKGKVMFDCYMVEDYEIHVNSIINIETWDGWNDFLHLCSLGFTNHVLDKFNNEDEILLRYQMKVALFIAAHFGHLDLAVTLCKQGVKPGEPVGLHPLRQWCPNNQHVDILKAPIHEAVECGQLAVLRSFVHQNITSILCRDGRGLQPLNIALRNKIKNCASFLLSKQWSRIPFNGSTITLSVFSKLKRWTERAKEKASLNYHADKLSFKKKIIQSFPLVGQGLYIDGYSPEQINSKSKYPNKKPNKCINVEPFYQNLYGGSPEQYFKNLDISITKVNRTRNVHKFRKINKSLSSATEGNSHESESQIGTPDKSSKDKQFKLPKIVSESSKLNGTRSRASSIQCNNILPQGDEKETQKKSKKKKKIQNSSDQILNFNNNKSDISLPLPLKSVDYTPRPYYYKGHNQTDDISNSIEIYYKDRGYLPREYAIKCLSLTNRLKDKSWLAQVRMAMNLGKESVKKNIHSQ